MEKTRPPKNPVTIAINGILTDHALKVFFERYLPSWDYKVTSGFRSIADQKRLLEKGLDPSKNSAHLFNLARDIVFINKSTGSQATDEQMKKLFMEFIAPHWQGYSYYSPKNKITSSGWVHLNLDRGITKATQYIGMAGLAWGIGATLQKVYKIYLTKGR